MRNIATVMTIVISLSAPALAQKAEIDANNAKWVELFNQGRFFRDCIPLQRRCDRIPARLRDGAGPSSHRGNVEEYG